MIEVTKKDCMLLLEPLDHGLTWYCGMPFISDYTLQSSKINTMVMDCVIFTLCVSLFEHNPYDHRLISKFDTAIYVRAPLPDKFVAQNLWNAKIAWKAMIRRYRYNKEEIDNLLAIVYPKNCQHLKSFLQQLLLIKL